MTRTIIVGGQFGDEGKGKIISHLALNDKPDIVARGGVGPNAGHEVHYKGKRYPLRLIPCGFVYEKARLLIGAGVVVDPNVLLKEIDLTGSKKRMGVDFRATWLTNEHLERDKTETAEKIGSTKTGCGPAVMDRVRRVAKTAQDCPELKPFLTDVPKELHAAKNVLIEGSQGFMLSVLYGTYPYSTSKDVGASSIAADVGLGPKDIDEVILAMKSYTTRVGGGPFQHEIAREEAERLGMQEYGTVTGRPRRISKELHWDDLKLAVQINSATQLAVTKLDIRFPGNAGKKKFADLTKEAQHFVQEIEKKLGVDVTLIGTGPDALDIIDRRK
ncbi:MAG TPA: adenylosuccinate synthetase [Candidatus Bilamarchaeaceae archaeon]|nr:adenylosuccinate synthetase [Candidatus Bilamarchaeaceae archaeon]